MIAPVAARAQSRSEKPCVMGFVTDEIDGGAERLQQRASDANRSAHTACRLVPLPIRSVIFMELSPSTVVLIGADGADRGTIWRRSNNMIGGFGDKLAGRSDTLY